MKRNAQASPLAFQEAPFAHFGVCNRKGNQKDTPKWRPYFDSHPKGRNRFGRATRWAFSRWPAASAATLQRGTGLWGEQNASLGSKQNSWLMFLGGCSALFVGMRHVWRGTRLSMEPVLCTCFLFRGHKSGALLRWHVKMDMNM